MGGYAGVAGREVGPSEERDAWEENRQAERATMAAREMAGHGELCGRRNLSPEFLRRNLLRRRRGHGARELRVASRWPTHGSVVRRPPDPRSLQPRRDPSRRRVAG